MNIGAQEILAILGAVFYWIVFLLIAVAIFIAVARFVLFLALKFIEGYKEPRKESESRDGA